jgi:hypothetical protein
MKQVLIVVFVLLLALPAVSFAGSATSRWDLTIGGFVKVDAGYANQAAGGGPAGMEAYFPDRNNANGNQNVSNAAGSFTEATGQTALSFLIQGPDTWGAKTTAFVMGNFLGQPTNNGQAGVRYGTFTLTHAYMDFTWASTKLIVGQNWQLWGFQPSYNFFGLFDLLMGGRGNTVPQISITQDFSKNFYGSFGIQEPYNFKDQLGGSANLGTANALQLGLTPNGTVGMVATNPRVTSEMPDFAAEIGYKSDACGRIGPNVMQFALGGFWGQDTMIYVDPNGPANHYSTDHVNRWGAAFKAFIPIIPEKNLNKAGSLSVSGSIFTGQNLANWFLGARAIIAPVPYDQEIGHGASPAWNTPVTTGGWAQVSYYLTDKVYLNGLAGYNRNYESATYKMIYPNQINQWQQWIVNLIYDVNPAVRFGVEYTYGNSSFNGPGLNNGGNAAPANGQLTGYTANSALLGTKGDFQIGRVCFWYFF